MCITWIKTYCCCFSDLQKITGSQKTIFNNLLCCPALLPQITGVLNPEVPDTTKESVQTPPLTSAEEDGPAV